MNAANEMMQPPVLSICVPTYNRADCLPALFDSVLANIATLRSPWQPSDIEMVVTDNASTDSTAEMIERYRSLFPRLVYRRHPENLGPDRNFLAVVDAATGQFCWLMGSDDKIEDGSLNRVLDATDEWRDAAGFSVNMAVYDSTLTVRGPAPNLLPISKDELVEGAGTIFARFGLYQGYLSGQVVRRDLWREVCDEGEQIAFLNVFVHLFVIGRMVQKVPRWGAIHQRCCGWRSGNDSFLGDGWVRRLQIDVEGFNSIAVALFGEHSDTVRTMRRRLIATYHHLQFRSAKLRRPSGKEFADASSLLARTYWRHPEFWLLIAPWIVTPGFLTRGMYRFYSRHLKSLRHRIGVRRERKAETSKTGLGS